MNRKVRLTLMAASFVAVVGIVAGVAIACDPAARVQGWLRGEPFYEGRSATAWQRQLNDPDENTAIAATTTLASGQEAAAPVCGWLLTQSSQPGVRIRAAEALKKMDQHAAPAAKDLVRALGDPDPLVRAVAIRAVGELKPGDAVPALIGCFPDVEAIRAVARYEKSGAEAVPKLNELTQSDDEAVRRQAVRALGKIGSPALPALPRIIQLTLSDPGPGVREQSAEAIGEIGVAAAEGIPALVKALKDTDAKVRRDAVRSLGQMGPAARQALPEVRTLAQDPEAIVREAAKKAARLIDPSGKS